MTSIAAAADDDAEYTAWKVERREQTAPYDIERWYETLGPSLTFPTTFIALAPEEAEALMATYSERVLHKRECVEAERRLVQELQSKLQLAMDSMDNASDGAGYFVRLSTRSPKDAARARSGQH